MPHYGGKWARGRKGFVREIPFVFSAVSDRNIFRAWLPLYLHNVGGFSLFVVALWHPGIDEILVNRAGDCVQPGAHRRETGAHQAGEKEARKSRYVRGHIQHVIRQYLVASCYNLKIS